MNIILFISLPFVLLYICFPWYASVSKAYRLNKLGAWDFAVLMWPLLFLFLLDVYCNIWASILYWDLPFNHGVTLSERSEYWLNQRPYSWRYEIARIVKLETDKFEPDHIKFKGF